MAKLKKEVLNQIRGDADLFAVVSKELGIKPTSLPMVLERNGNSLNRYSVVALVANYLGVEPAEILEPESKDTVAAA